VSILIHSRLAAVLFSTIASVTPCGLHLRDMRGVFPRVPDPSPLVASSLLTAHSWLSLRASPPGRKPSSFFSFPHNLALWSPSGVGFFFFLLFAGKTFIFRSFADCSALFLSPPPGQTSTPESPFFSLAQISYACPLFIFRNHLFIYPESDLSFFFRVTGIDCEFSS